MRLFDESNPRYINAYKKALDELLKQNVIFEVNTGAIARGFRSVPYPSKEILAYIKEHGGKTVLSSDCHSKDKLMFGFSEYQKYLF